MIKYELVELKKDVYLHNININGFSINISNSLSRFERDYLKYITLNTNDILSVDSEIRMYNDKSYEAVVIENLKTHLKITLSLGSLKSSVLKAINTEKTERVLNNDVE